MENGQERQALNNFDRQIGALTGLPDVAHTKPATLRVVPLLGIGSHLYAVQTFRQREAGDSIFIEHVSDGGTVRIVLPPAVADCIARQREQLTSKTRSRAAKLVAADRMARGIKPGFLKK